MRGEGRGAAWSDGVGWCESGPPRPPRAYPACLLRSHAPLSLGAKGAGWMDVPSAEAPAFAGMTEGVSYDGGLRRGDSRIAPSPSPWPSPIEGEGMDSCLRRNDGSGYSPPVTAVIWNWV